MNQSNMMDQGSPIQSSISNTKAPKRRIDGVIIKSKTTHLFYIDLKQSEIVVVEEHKASEASESDLEAIIRKLMAGPTTVTKKPSYLTQRALVNRQRDDESESEPFVSPPSIMDVSDDKAHENLHTNTHLKAMQRFLEQPRFNHLRDFCNGRRAGAPLHPSCRPYDEEAASSATTTTPTKLCNLVQSPSGKYSFLVSLNGHMKTKSLLHPVALKFRENFAERKEHLTALLVELYQERLQLGRLPIEVTWSKQQPNVMAYCICRRCGHTNNRTCTIVLNAKLVISTDRLRGTLIRELCKAADWVAHGHIASGPSAYRHWDAIIAEKLPELHPIHAACDQTAPLAAVYPSWHRFAFWCTLCGCNSKAQWLPRTAPEMLRCAHCLGGIEVHNQFNRSGPLLFSSVPRATNGFAQFVHREYRNVWQTLRASATQRNVTGNHTEAMRILSIQYEEAKKFN